MLSSIKDIKKEYLRDKNRNITLPELLKFDLANTYTIDIHNIFILGNILGRSVLIRKSKNEFEYFPIQRDQISEPFLQNHRDNILGVEKFEISYKINVKNPPIFINRIEKPLVKLVSLFHQENFPLPRFPLGISDIASAIRENCLGRVILSDMQFSKSIYDITKEIIVEKPEIIGVSATFGQQGLLEDLVDLIQEIENYHPLIIFGGSLSTLNTEKLLTKFPKSLVARGYGETTMQDIVKFWHGLISKEEINFISYLENDEILTTENRKDDKNIYANPELDLLEETLKFKGVMQLESSRGCTYHCSFCPRSHKGQWSGETGNDFQDLIPFVKNIFDKYPNITHKIFVIS